MIPLRGIFEKGVTGKPRASGDDPKDVNPGKTSAK